jgi:glycosyltransferase involved in cell wall biosynthesis
MNPEGKPAVSVIIIAHDRKEYLREAVQSVLAQDLERSKIELIVVKNFRDDSLDSFLKESGAENLVCESIPAARKLEEGFRRSRAPIICILEDDDMFEPNRLRVILNEFSADPGLGFYRNQLSFIGPGGEPLSRRALGPFRFRVAARQRRVRLRDNDKPAGVRSVAGSHPDFNVSSSAIRRELMDHVMPYLSGISFAVDTLLFYEALCSPWTILFDNRRLTRYRVHGKNVTLGERRDLDSMSARLLDFTKITDRDYRVIWDLVSRYGRPFSIRQIEARILLNDLTRATRDPTSGRKTFGRLFLQLLRHADTYPVRDSPLFTLASLSFAILPRTSRLAYWRTLTIR